MNTFFKEIITSVVVFISLSRAGQGIAERRSDVDSGDVGYTISVEKNTEVTQDKEGVNKDTVLEVREGIEKSSLIPVLREGPGQPASQELVEKILEANKFWLHPDVKYLSYTFSMKHTNADDLWKATVKFTGPDQLTVIPMNGKKFEGKVDDTYDPDNNAYPPRLTTILQGVKFFGPMHQFHMVPEEHALFVVGEEYLKGNNVYIIHLKPIGEPSQNAIERWERRIRKNAMHSKYMYEFLPVEKEINSVKQVVIEIKTRYNEGPSWEYIKAAHNTNSAQIKWGGKIITADIHNYRGKERPVIVLDRDPDFQGESPIRGITFEGGVDNMTLKLVLGEGEEIFDEEIYNKEKTTRPKPERGLPIRIGCGVWKLSYGHAGHGVKIDQIWVDKTTCNILREEGFNKEHESSFIVEYGDFETITGGRQVPRHIVVTLNGKNDEYFHLYPWVFDMKFMTRGGTVWLLKRLEEFQDTKEPVAIAEVFDVTLKPDSVKKDFTEEKTWLHNEQRKITAEYIWNRQLSYFQKISTLEFNLIMSEKGSPLKSMNKFVSKRERYRSETFRLNESSEATTKDTNKTIVSYDGQLYQTLGIEGGIQCLAVSKDKAFRHASYMLGNPILLSFLFALPDRWSDSGTTSIDTLRKSDTWARLVNATENIRQANFDGHSGVWLKLRREEGYVVKGKAIYEIFFAKELDYFPIGGRVTNWEDKKGADWRVLGTKKCGNEGIIIPTRIKSTEYNEEGKAWQVTILEIDPKTVQVNHEVNDDIFTIQAPQDVKYVDLDAKLGKEIDYRQKEKNSGVKKAPDEILMEMSSEERKIFGKIAGGDIRIVEIAKSHLLREKPTMKQAQLGKSYIDFDLTHVPKLIKVPFLVVSGAAREEIEGETFRTIHTTYPTITVLIDFTGKLVSIEEGSMVTTHYHANRTSAENALIEFLRQGVEHATSLIRDARAHYVFKQDGWMYKEVNWAYQPGKEFLRFKIFRKNGELAGDNACYYDGQKTVVFLYPMGNKNEKPSASISSGESIFKLKTIPQYPPTTLFLRFWPVGITLDQILSNEGTILLPQKEVVDKSQCYVIDLKSVGGDYEDLGYKIWLDSERGFLPRRIEIRKEGKVRIAIGPIILDRFGENIWFPVRAEIKTYYEKVRETNIEMDQIKINERLDESIFVPTFEPGMTVHDHQLDKSYTIPQP